MNRVNIYTILENTSTDKDIFDNLKSTKVDFIVIETDVDEIIIKNPDVNLRESYVDLGEWCCQVELEGIVDKEYNLIFQAYLYLKNGFITRLDVIDYDYCDEDDKFLISGQEITRNDLMFAVGYIPSTITEDKQPIYVYGETQLVQEFLEPYSQIPNRCRSTQSTMCRFFESEEAMERYLNVIRVSVNKAYISHAVQFI